MAPSLSLQRNRLQVFGFGRAKHMCRRRSSRSPIPRASATTPAHSMSACSRTSRAAARWLSELSVREADASHHRPRSAVGTCQFCAVEA
eukprot:11026004-Ditylum_brightwellii.AAC.1